MFFDTHAHYDASSFGEEAEDILAKLPECGISYVVNPACDLLSSERALEFSRKFPHVYAAVGIHPSDVKDLDMISTLSALETLAKQPKVVAIGEIGLDYYWEENASKEVQKEFLHNQMELAEKLSLPVIFHDREAHEDSILAVSDHPHVRGVFHCYSGSVESAKKLLDLGYIFSFTGVITFKNARKTLDVIEYLPLDAIMLETDAPYLAPEPYRGKRNDSRNLPFIAQVVADLKGISLEECAKITTENGKKFFRIP